MKAERTSTTRLKQKVKRQMENYSKEILREMVKMMFVDKLKKGEFNINNLLKKQPTIKMEIKMDGKPFIFLLNDFKMHKGYFEWNVVPISDLN